MSKRVGSRILLVVGAVVLADVFFLVALSGITFREYGLSELRKYHPQCATASYLKACIVWEIQKEMINPL